MAYVTLRPRRFNGVDYPAGVVVPDAVVNGRMVSLGLVVTAGVPLAGSFVRTHPLAEVTVAQLAAATGGSSDAFVAAFA